MNIEEAIKQSKPFKSPYQKAGVNLMYSSNWLAGHLEKFFKSYGVTLKQFNILRILKGAQRPVSTLFIRERLLDKMSDVSRIVDRLESKSLVKKSNCETDKRLVDVELSDNGKALLENVNKEMGIMETLFEKLTLKEVTLLNELLDKLRGN